MPTEGSCRIVHASDDRRTGIGSLEQIVIGPHAPAGLAEFSDGA